MEMLASLSPTVGLFGSLFNTGMSAVGAYEAAASSNYSKEWNATQAEIASKIAAIKADTFRQLGETEKFEVMQQYEAIRSAQRSEYGAAGVNVNVGSAMEQQIQTTKVGVYESQKAQYQRNLQAWEMDVESRNQQLVAQLNRSSMGNPWMSAVTASVGGLTGAFAQFGQWQKQSNVSQVSETSSYMSKMWI